MKDIYDVVVIGSGFGGAINACRLAEAGRSVCVLERGKRWGRKDFPRTIGQVGKSFWNHKDFGLLDYRIFKKIDVIQASGVGGGSLVYFNVHERALKEIFELPGWPAGVKRETLDPFYDKAKFMLDAQQLIPPDTYDYPGRTKALIDGGTKMGRDAKLMNIAVYTGPDRLNPHSGLPQEGCVYCGNCMLGCHVHAKNTLDLNYIPVAEQHGAEVYPLHSVVKIEPLDAAKKDGYRVYFQHYETGKEDTYTEGSVVGRKVIVSAGSLGSTELLLRCRDTHKTLPGLGAMLGKRWSGNGDFLLAGTFNVNQEVDPGCGPSITAGFDCSTDSNKIFIQDVGYPDPLLWYLEGALPMPGRWEQIKHFLKIYIFRILGLSKASAFTVGMEKLFGGGITTRWLPYLGMGTDAGDGEMTLSDNNIDIAWSHTKSKKMFNEMEDELGRLSDALEGDYKTSLLWKWPVKKLLTAHPLGGCIMGETAETGVVNEFGEVWNYPNLYVADGSIIPTALSINPSATISALSERIADHIVHSYDPG
jgi:cholesterol oxidase